MHALPIKSALPTKSAAQPVPTDADRARARMDRIAGPAPKPDRPFHDGARDADAPRRPRHGTGNRGGFSLGWGAWLAIELVAVAAVAAAVLVWPPAIACRDQEAKMGFYAGDTLGKCIRRGVLARLDTLDQRLKMAVRGSGR